MPIITKWADIAQLGGDDWLSPAEQELIAACKAGEPCALGDGGVPAPGRVDPARDIRAEVLRYLILGGCDDCRVQGWGIRLLGAHVTGPLDLSFARARAATGLINCRFSDPVLAHQARFETLALNGSHLPGLNAQGAQVTSSVFLLRITATSTVDLNGATIGGQLSCIGARFEAETGHGFNAEGAQVTGHVFLGGITATSTVDLKGATIGGQLSCIGARFEAETGHGFNAQGAQVTGGFFLRGITATSTVDLNAAIIGGQLACEDARFEAETGYGFNAQGVQVTGDVFLSRITATSTVDLNGATIGGQLDCTGARFEAKTGVALNAQGMTAAALIWRNLPAPTAWVDLHAARIDTINDDPVCWPAAGKLILDGLSYARFLATDTTSAARLPWLESGSHVAGDFHPQPFTQCAKVLREMGHEADARRILIRRETLIQRAQRDRLRITPNGDVRVGLLSIWRDMRRLWNWFWTAVFYAIAGYGYRPFLSVVWIVALIAILYLPSKWAWNEGSFAPNSGPVLVSPAWQALATDAAVNNPAATWTSAGAAGQDWESFQPLAYAADVVIPIVEIGQTSAWAPSTERGWWGWHLWWMRWVFTALGWIAAALGAAAVTGIIRRD